VGLIFAEFLLSFQMSRCLQFSALLAAVVSFFSEVRASGAETRIWTDTNGKTVSAEFAGLAGEVISLKTADGRVFQIPLGRLREDDREVARKLASDPALKAEANSIANIPVPHSAQSRRRSSTSCWTRTWRRRN
jgi:SLA1 homology domain 1, SHD1